jgi:hypothetical protein
MMMDIKKYYLGTQLLRFEYMKMPLSHFLEEIIQKYNLNTLAVDGWVYIEIRKGMYRLKQAGLHTYKSKCPESHPTKECACARVRCLKAEPNCYYCPIAIVMS